VKANIAITKGGLLNNW